MRRAAGLMAVLVGGVVIALLGYAFAIAIELPAAERAAPLATIATGIALLAVAALAYLLQLRSVELQRQSFDALHEPSLGIIWKDPAMLPSREIATAELKDVYAEYVMWNAGDVTILVQQPFPALPPGAGPANPSRERVELERVLGSEEAVLEKSFPIVLGRGEVCIWRQFTGDVSHLRPLMSEIHDVDREQAVKFLQKQQGDRHFLFEVVYFSKPPATLTQSHTHKQYVGFAYQVSDGRGDGREEFRGRIP